MPKWPKHSNIIFLISFGLHFENFWPIIEGEHSEKKTYIHNTYCTSISDINQRNQSIAEKVTGVIWSYFTVDYLIPQYWAWNSTTRFIFDVRMICRAQRTAIGHLNYWCWPIISFRTSELHRCELRRPEKFSKWRRKEQRLDLMVNCWLVHHYLLTMQLC